MKEMDPGLVRKELVESLDFILELDRKPAMLKRLPKRSVMVKKGKKRLVIPTSSESGITMLV